MKNWLWVPLFILSSCAKDDPVPLTYEQQLALDVEIIDNYLAANNITNVVEDPSGLRYVVHTMGTGRVPSGLDAVLKVDYELRLLSDPTLIGKAPVPVPFFPFPMSQLIMGWQIAFQQLPVGTVATLYIPSGLAYGPYGNAPSIPPNANIVFDVTFLDFLGGTVFDSEGFEHSTTIVDETQEWLVENLRTSHYENDEAILTTEWSSPMNDSFLEESDGKLYSFAAAIDPRKVCPEGFRLPTPEEFTGHSDLLITLRRAGRRDETGNFVDYDNKGYYWTSADVAGTNDAIAFVYHSDGSFSTVAVNKTSHLSVRCIGDN